MIFNKDFCSIYGKDGELIARCKPFNGIYKFENEFSLYLLTTAEINTADTWHRRLGHINYKSLCKMRDGAFTGIQFPNAKIGPPSCKICAEGKQTRLPFEHSQSKTSHVLELIHSDLIGPMETRSIGGAKYILSSIDDFSRKVFIYFSRENSMVFGCFQSLSRESN